MKKIRCLTNISAVKINDQIINFDVFPNKDKVVEVEDHIAKILLKREGYEEVKEKVKAVIKETIKEEVQEIKEEAKEVIETVIQPKLEQASRNFFTRLWEKLKKAVGGK